TKAATRWFSTEAVAGREDPMLGSPGVCCARAANGPAAAAPPRSVMNSRRFIEYPPYSPTRPNHLVGMGTRVFRKLPVGEERTQRGLASAGLKFGSTYQS